MNRGLWIEVDKPLGRETGVAAGRRSAQVDERRRLSVKDGLRLDHRLII